MAYATVPDLELRLRRALTPEEQLQAEATLEDASLMVDVECPLPDPPTAQDLDARRVVVCNMAARVWSTPVDAVGVSSIQQGAGPYQQSYSYANPSGDLYLSKTDKKLLGCSRQVVFTATMGEPVPCPLDYLP